MEGGLVQRILEDVLLHGHGVGGGHQPHGLGVHAEHGGVLHILLGVGQSKHQQLLGGDLDMFGCGDHGAAGDAQQLVGKVKCRRLLAASGQCGQGQDDGKGQRNDLVGMSHSIVSFLRLHLGYGTV